MRLKITFIFILLFCNAKLKSQNITQIDTSLEKKISLNGFCLCKTTLSDLQNSYKDLKETEVEEMDLGKKCMGGDARFTNGKGYYTEKYPGIIFQKDQDEDCISKFRLTKNFIGNLPDGTPINMNNLLLKDIIKQYPESIFKWGSRDCSDYWTYSNDTISFFLKIDRNKKPQYPLDEDYYLNRPVDAIDIFISCYSILHKEDKKELFAPDEPMYFLDSIRANESFIKNAIDPNEIAIVSVYKDSTAIKLKGNDAKNGLIYIITKQFARDHYWNYFKSKSTDYQKSVSSLNVEKNVIYILNDKVLQSNWEAALFGINDDNFIDLKVINKEELKKEYNISDKSFGVIIRTKSH